MTKQIFGSVLAKKLFPDFREPKDKDFLVDDLSKHKSIIGKEEYYHIPCLPIDRELTADELYTVKVSHAIRNIHWSKTMTDIRFFQIKGCKVIPSLLKELREHWNEYHGIQNRTNFEVGMDNFFKDKIKRKIPHDELHKKLNQFPSYLKIVDNGLIPNQTKFNDLLECEKIEVCYEEAFVIAIERFIYKDPFRKSYNLAQQALVTRLHPEWIADYVIENWNKTFWKIENSESHKQFLLLAEKFKELQ